MFEVLYLTFANNYNYLTVIFILCTHQLFRCAFLDKNTLRYGPV